MKKQSKQEEKIEKAYNAFPFELPSINWEEGIGYYLENPSVEELENLARFFEDEPVHSTQLEVEIENWIDAKSFLKAMKTQEQIKQLLDDYIVVKFYDEDSNETTMKVTKRNNFEETNLCECYVKYGQKVGCWNSGCYSLANPDSDAMKDLIAAIEEKFDVTPGIVECPDGSFEVEPDSETEDIEHEINQFIKKWQEENEYHLEAKAWTFFDSSNYRTIVLENEYYDADCEELSEEEQIAILSEMPELPYYVEGTNASEETENYTFYFDRWANNPWICFVEKNDN